MLRGTLTRFGRSSAPRPEEFGKVLELVPVGSGIDKFDGKGLLSIDLVIKQLEIIRKLRQLGDWEFLRMWYLLRSFPRVPFWYMCLSISRTCSDHRGQIPCRARFFL